MLKHRELKAARPRATHSDHVRRAGTTKLLSLRSRRGPAAAGQFLRRTPTEELPFYSSPCKSMVFFFGL